MQISADLRRLLCEQVVCLITEKKEHTDHFPFSYIFLFILKSAVIFLFLFFIFIFNDLQ